MQMISIQTDNEFVTHINVFTVDPAKQQAFVESLKATVKAAQGMEGWVSASIHQSLDGTKVTNYVQFEDVEAARCVSRKLFEGGNIQRNTALGRVAPGEYEVAFALSSE